MSTNEHDAPTVARTIAELSGDDAATGIYVSPARRVRPAAAVFQTMTVRAVAALSGSVTAGPSTRPTARRTQRAPNRMRTAWALAAVSSCLSALTGVWLAAHTQPTQPQPPALTPARVARAASIPAPATPLTPIALPTAPPTPTPAPTQDSPARTRRTRATPASAADDLTAGNYPAALDGYRQLANDHPDVPVYAAIARILERDLARRCTPPSNPACNR